MHLGLTGATAWTDLTNQGVPDKSSVHLTGSMMCSAF